MPYRKKCALKKCRKIVRMWRKHHHKRATLKKKRALKRAGYALVRKYKNIRLRKR